MVWALLVAVAVFSGVIAVLVFDKYGDPILERFLGSPRASVQQPMIPVEEVAVPEEAEAADPEELEQVGELESAEALDETAAPTEAEADADETTEIEPAKAVPVVEPPRPTEDGATLEPVKSRRRLREKRASDTAPDASTGIKKLGEDSLSAEEQKLLADFGSSGSAGVAKIDVAESGSSASKRDPLDSKAVSATVNTNKPRLQRCYERAIRGQQAPTAVRMNVSINVAPSGRVSSTDVAGTGPGGLKECIEASIRRWRFMAHHDSQVGAVLPRPRPVVGVRPRGVVGVGIGPVLVSPVRRPGVSIGWPVAGRGKSRGAGLTKPGPWMRAASSRVRPLAASHAPRSARPCTSGTKAWFCSRARSWSRSWAPDTSIRCASAQRRPRSSMKLGIARPANARV